MTTDCIDNVHFRAETADRHLHDVVIGLVVAVVFIIPITLGVFTLL
ncbi:MAG: hypothetical protein KKE02_08465 [Alphaproteobacteria bacterium]|nr:hypothetical protein [Alphaproteobacteria bacterium]MBU1515009.1 hypothetical protein [Alphaproteobacteria bacterium]MBU2095658.1 hypothetical protein [Alphaproteobacteria bacterium]MBU2151038.1 hypothetical protein [Alphaproteobacteria bacterium]MBU2306901.1 hypothetical protein [Alphaproteobacteria bacterium]